MGYLMSIDLGTSSVRVMIMREDGTNMTTCGEGYDTNIPKAGFAEQNPEVWYKQTVTTIRRCMQQATINKDEIRALSFSGQMHGLVCLDKKIYYPIDKNVSAYRSYYEIFQELYKTNKKLFKQISKLEEKESK